MSFAAMGPREEPGPGRFPNFVLLVAPSFETQDRPIIAHCTLLAGALLGRKVGEHAGVSHLSVGPLKQHI